MGFSMELVKARRRIKKLEGELAEAKDDITDLLEQLAFGIEKPSPADIVKQTGISADNTTAKFIIDANQLNIPFTKQPRLLPIALIPDTGSMDRIFDYGNNLLYVVPNGETDHKVMVDWIAKQWLDSKGLQTVDAVTRIMVNDADDPNDFKKPHKWYSIHRLVEVGSDEQGRYFWFAGVNNLARDPYPARDKNILYFSIGVID